jgi:quercetin dioxygenase-like cupin family protein
MNSRLFLWLVFVPALYAGDSDAVKVWKAQQLKAYEKTLAPKTNQQKNANEKLADYGNSWMETVHREGDGEVEIHQGWHDVMFIQTGEGELLIGGTVVNPRTTRPGEIRGTTITGGEKKAVSPGDIVRVPANLPHQFLVPAGKQVTYFVAKVAAQGGDTKGFVMWKNADLKALDKSLAARVNQERVASQPLGDFGNHKTIVVHRGATGDVNLHQEWTDLFVIEAGEGELVSGGTLKDPKTVGPGQIHGSSIEGGQKISLAPGDMLHIPANLPHWVVVPPGKHITYFELNVKSK